MWGACARRSTAAAPTIPSAPCADQATRSTSGSDASYGVWRSGAHRSPVAATIVGRLVGHAGMIGAVGKVCDRLAAAKEEIGGAWVADGPAAFRVRQFEQRAALADRHDVFQRLRLELRLQLVDGKPCQCGITADRGPRHVAQHVRRRPWLAWPWHRRGGRLGAARQAQPVHLANNRIAGDAAELGRDLARRLALRPQLLQKLHTVIGPTRVLLLAGEIHLSALLKSPCGGTRPTLESLHAARQPEAAGTEQTHYS